MNWTAALFLAGFFHLSAAAFSQGGITLSLKNAPLEKVFEALETQSGYTFWYDNAILQNSHPVDVYVRNAEVEDVLKICFKNQSFSYQIVGRMIVIKQKSTDSPVAKPDEIRGKVVSENGNPIAGVSVTVKGTQYGTTTDSEGKFIIPEAEEKMTLVFSGIHVEDRELLVTSRRELMVVLKIKVNKLDEIQIIAYGTTTRRETTGSYSKISSTEISDQPVSNPLAAMQGRSAGMVVTQSNGLPGSPFSVLIRGQNSISGGNQPLYLIDGIPFTNSSLTQLASANQSQSPFNSINPADIESIEILKDADATAIYGSRGANGVVLITTKKAKAGKTTVSFDVYTGLGTTTRKMNLMNTPQYLTMRRQAFEHDGVQPGIDNAPDLFVWDTSSYTNWQKKLTGGTANITQATANLSGGSERTQFLIGASYNYQSTVFPGSLSDNRIGMHFNTVHRSQDNRFHSTLSASYSYDDNRLIQSDLTYAISTAPDAPDPYDSTGKLNWFYHGSNFDNPLAILSRPHYGKTDNLITQWLLSYQILKGLTIKTNLGYTYIQHNESQLTPLYTLNPMYGLTSGFASFGNNSFKTWIVEPQAEYNYSKGKNKLQVLLGGTWQQQADKGTVIYSGNFSSDDLLGDPGSAGSNFVLTNNSEYRYQAIFGRINYNYDERYILNFTARRDGSSRFGPANRYANFGAIGAAWIFYKKEADDNTHVAFSFGKLRVSYGITGNDQVGNYQYLESWQSTIYPYQGQPGMIPARLFNPNYKWEVNRKAEAGLDLGFFGDRLLVTLDVYVNNSSNQLVNYTLPVQTGFNSILENLDAQIRNTGFEMEIHSTNIRSKKFSWSSSLNFTIAKNELVSFPGLASSSYANQYVIGQPLSVMRLFQYQQVDPKTGLYTFNGTAIPEDQTSYQNITPRFYGGLSNSLTYKSWKLDIFFQFVSQNGLNYRNFNTLPGIMVNQPVEVNNAWQASGDMSSTQVYTTGYNSEAVTAFTNYQKSNAVVSDASFIRLKNISVTYTLPARWFEPLMETAPSVYLQGQNLFTICNYLGGDPETQNYNTLPPLKVITLGFRCTL